MADEKAREVPDMAADPVPACGDGHIGKDGGRRSRNVVLFSDGTGNSSAKLFKTNVWRMYEAVDLGATAVEADQIVYYDEGVGNSGFRPLAVLGGVFGWGLKRNVLDLYAFLCRNHRDGDRIFLFGFSRGAFTARVLAGLIAQQGLVEYRGEADLGHQAAAAYRCYRRDRLPRWPPMRWLLPCLHLLMAVVILAKRGLLRQRRYDQARNKSVDIHFVGVWDTVAAYGGPIVEVVRAVDDWITRLSFKDQILSKRVRFARQALALDDERDAFQPVPWDEPFPTDRERLMQVWFAGMHADVGGGYPDDSLAYVSLAWMMREAQAKGLKLRKERVDEANRTANAFGPIHDSRSGLGGYYRYQPRLVGAYVKPPEPDTTSIEDPAYAGQGIRRVYVHESVIARIAAGTDGYAPITLPEQFEIVGDGPTLKLPTGLADRLSRTAAARADRQEALRDLVWIRRLLYFATVLASLGLATMPFWPWTTDVGICSDSRCILGDVYSWLKLVLPGFAERWVIAFADAPAVTTVLLLAIAGCMILSAAVEGRLRDTMRRVWRASRRGILAPTVRRSWLRTVRTSRIYQGTLSAFKWHVLPAVIGVSMLACLAWLVALAATQLRLTLGEGRGLFCRGAVAAGPGMAVARPCNDLGVRVQRGGLYRIRLSVGDSWWDGNVPGGPGGIEAARLYRRVPVVGVDLPVGHLAAPFRRVVSAPYLQPLAVIEPGGLKPVQVTSLHVMPGPNGSHVARFPVARDGRLTIGVNDAVPPWPFRPDTFYSGMRQGANKGSACVAVTRLSPAPIEVLSSCPRSLAR